MAKNAPCGSCPRKGCGSYHSTCKEYLDWKAKKDAELAAKRRTITIREYDYDVKDKKAAAYRKGKR